MQLSKAIRQGWFSECIAEGKISSVGKGCSITGKGLPVNNFLSIMERVIMFVQSTLPMNQQAISQWYLPNNNIMFTEDTSTQNNQSRTVQSFVSWNALIYASISSLCFHMHGVLAVTISRPVSSDFACCARWHMNIPIWLICLYKMIKPVYFPHNI